MEKTTTPVDGAAPAAQPAADDSAQPTEAVEAAHSEDQVITTDENGTPALEAVTSEEVQADESKDESQANSDTIEWAKNKGLEINPDNPNEIKLAQMQREAEKKMHQATAAKVEPPQEVPLTGDEALDEVVARQNVTDMKLYVRDWFDTNPDMKEYRAELTKIASDRPWLQNMDDVKAHFLANPDQAQRLRAEGGKQALTNLAQKQQAIPPAAGATNSAVYETATITPQNVYELVDKNNQEWFEKNHKAISKAMSQ